MLNIAIGLQFNISSGRCTRGAFIQLLSLDEDFKLETNYSYVLVHEGLHAPGHYPKDTLEHENELAMFVIGLVK